VHPEPHKEMKRIKQYRAESHWHHVEMVWVHYFY